MFQIVLYLKLFLFLKSGESINPHCCSHNGRCVADVGPHTSLLALAELLCEYSTDVRSSKGPEKGPERGAYNR